MTPRLVLMNLLIAFALSPAGLVPQSQGTPRRSNAISVPEDRVDINTATIDQLLKVPGMARTWAERIVRYRPYHAKNELLDRGIVTSAIYDRIKDYIVAHRPPQ